jgi:menaquinone-specific isochorismate synthase
MPLTEPLPPEALRSALTHRIGRFFAESPLAGQPGCLMRLQVPIAAIDALAWLRAQPSPHKIYWMERQGAFEMAGIGIADRVAGDRWDAGEKVFSRMRPFGPKASERKSDLRYYGGFRFDPSAVCERPWRPFGGYRFVVPRMEVFQRPDDAWLACNFVVPEKTGVRSLENQLHDALARLSWDSHPVADAVPQALSRENRPERGQWEQMIRATLRIIHGGHMDKVVIAREAGLRFAQALDPFDILGRLRTLDPQAVLFGVQPDADTGFIGCSPELLYHRSERRIYSEAIAGTRPRGADAATDRQLAQDLLCSDKDCREHRIVMESIAETLGGLCRHLTGDPQVTVLKLNRLQHLFAGFRGELNASVTDDQIVNTLHPSPAVGGFPPAKAREKIRSLEPFDRGWYAAPVGWVGADQAEFAVAIRSGLVAADTLYLYSGGGIVPGSRPEAEWEEIESKIGNFLNVLEIDGHPHQQHQQPLGPPDYRRAV